jgi:glycine/D-amino acid oxidase-like deaminating enzyme
MTGVYEPRAGYLRVEDCVAAQLDDAVRAGATLQTNESAVAWRIDGETVTVETDRDCYEAPRLVIAAGAWAGQLLAELNVPLVIRRKPQYWFAPRGQAYRADRGTPAYLYETPAGCYYGFPVVGPEGMKCAEHSGGRILADPLDQHREIDRDDLAGVERFIAACLPELTTTLNDHAPCLYTMSPDEHFLVDVHPRHPQVSFAAGMSGHGFKFAPVLGEALADLAMTGRSSLPIGFLSVRRFAGGAL